MLRESGEWVLTSKKIENFDQQIPTDLDDSVVINQLEMDALGLSMNIKVM